MTPFVGNYSPAELEQGRKDIAETSPEKIEKLYRTGKISLPAKLEMLRGYGQMKRELQIRDMSAAGTGGAMGEIKQYAIGVMKESEKAWNAAVKMWQSDQGILKTIQPLPAAQPGQISFKGQALANLAKQPEKSKGALAGEVVFHSLMAGLEGLKAYDIPGNIMERWGLEAGFDPSYARAANWAVWVPTNFLGITRTLQLPFKALGKSIRMEREALKGVDAKVYGWMKWVSDPVGEATRSAMKLNEAETAHVLSQLDQAIMQSEVGQSFKAVADAVTAAEKTGVYTSAKEAPEVSAEVVRRGQAHMAGPQGLEGFIPDDVFIPSPDAFEKAAVSDLIKFYEQKSNVFVRKGVKHAQTEAEAVGKMSFEEIVSRPPGSAMSAAELAYTARVNDAIRRGMEDVIAESKPVVDEIIAGNRNDLAGLFRAHFSAFAQTNPVFLGASGEVGRGLEFMKVLQPEVQAARVYDDMLKALGSDALAESNNAALGKAIMKLSMLEQDARKAFLDAGTSAKSPSIWHSLFKSLLFPVPATHVANLAGQNTGAFLQMAQYTGASLAGGEGAPAFRQAVGLWKGFGSAWLHLPKLIRTATERSGENISKLGLEGAKDAVARYGPNRWLNFGDELVGAALEGGYVNAEVIGQGLEQGLSGRALTDFITRTKGDVAAVTDLAAKVHPTVEHAMFHDQLSPAFESILSAIRNSKADFWLPVVKFPINSIKATRDWTPGMQFLSAKFIDDIAAGGAREAEARSRVTLSWMMANAIWGEAKVGNITGGGPTDPEKNKAWRAAGNVPYAWRGVPYRWLEPVGSLIGGVADMAYFSNQMEPDDVEDYAAGLGVTLSRMVENNWWLRTLDGVTSVVTDLKSASKFSDLLTAGGKFVLQPGITVATGGPMGARVREMLDPEVKQINNFADYFLAKTPGYSRYVAPMLNYSGNVKTIPPILGHRWLSFILPSGLRGEGTSDPVGAFMYKHGLELPDRWKNLGGQDDERPFFEPGQGKIGPSLTSDQSHNWKLLSLTDAKRYDDLTWVAKIAELDNDEAFNAKSHYQKQKQVSSLYENYRKKGEKMLISLDPDVAAKAELAKLKTRELRGKALPEEVDLIDVSEESPDQQIAPTEPPPTMELVPEPQINGPVPDINIQ